MDPIVRHAIARIDVVDGVNVVRRGTGCLVADNLVLTALHVVADRSSRPLAFHHGDIRITFPMHSTSATILDGRWSPDEDWVLLACDSPLPATIVPLRLAMVGRHDERWETYGFPDAQPDDGMVCRGTIENCDGTLAGVAVHQLFCRQAAAGDGLPVRGLSGAPVVVAGAVVGILRWALLTEGKSVGGTIYACPSSLITTRCPEYLPGPLTVVSAPTPTRSIAWPPPLEFSAYIEDRRTGFVGRSWLFREIDEWLSAPGLRALVVTVDYGVSKSAFLSELVARERARRAGTRVAAYHFCRRTSVGTLDPVVFVRSVASQLRDTIPEYGATVEAQPALLDQLGGRTSSLFVAVEIFETCIASPLHRISAPETPRVLVIDALDETLDTGPDAQTILDVLAQRARLLPSWICLLATARRRHEVTDALSAFGVREINAEAEENTIDLCEFVRGKCAERQVARPLAQAQVSAEDVVDAISTRARGKFLYATYVLQAIATGRLAPREVAILPPGMDGFYRDSFARRFKAQDYAPVRDVLGIMCAADAPLHRPEIAAALGTTTTDVARRLSAVVDFLPARNNLVSFDHLSMREWLTTATTHGLLRAGDFAVDLGAAREWLRRWALGEVAHERAHQSPHLVSHLAAHLQSTERADIFRRLLFGPSWLTARLEGGRTNALLVDCRWIANDPEVDELEHALRNAAHVLDVEPAHLPSQLLGRLLDSDQPSVVGLLQKTREHARQHGFALIPVTASLRESRALQRILVGVGCRN